MPVVGPRYIFYAHRSVMFTIDRARSSKPMGVETLIYYLHCAPDHSVNNISVFERPLVRSSSCSALYILC